MTRARNPSPTLPMWRLSAPLPDEPVAEAEANAPLAEPPARKLSVTVCCVSIQPYSPVAEPVAEELPPKANVPVEEAVLEPVWLAVGAAVAELVRK